MPMSPEERQLWAEDAHAWLISYMDAGFTEDQAFRLIVASAGRSQYGTTIPPELSELMSKMTALADRDLSE